MRTCHLASLVLGSRSGAFVTESSQRHRSKTFTLPVTLLDSSLLLSPHVFLLGILFRHKAFRAQGLTSPEQLHKLDIHPGERELPLPLRPDLDDVHIFHRAVKILTGYEISPDRPITYGMIAAWTEMIGEIPGLEIGTTPYNVRYNAANEFDKSGLFSSWLL